MTPKYFSTLITTIAIIGLISCSDVTNISKEQLQDSGFTIDLNHSGINDVNQPLFILNGKQLSSDNVMRLNPEHVESISVIKGETALKKYGKKGQHGVIKIYADTKILEDLKPVSSAE